MNLIKIYAAVVERARSRPLPDVHYEWHHIIPVFMGGTNDPENLVALTVKEHYVLHHLLARINADDFRALSVWRLMRGRYRKSENLPASRKPRYVYQPRQRIKTEAAARAQKSEPPLAEKAEELSESVKAQIFEMYIVGFRSDLIAALLQLPHTPIKHLINAAPLRRPDCRFQPARNAYAQAYRTLVGAKH